MMKKIKGSVPKHSLVTLYKTVVEPYLRYCDIIWGQCGNTRIEKVQKLQNKAARIISRTSFEETNHDDLLRELNWMNVKQLVTILLLLCLKWEMDYRPHNVQKISKLSVRYMDTRQDPWEVKIIISRNLANLTVRKPSHTSEQRHGITSQYRWRMPICSFDVYVQEKIKGVFDEKYWNVKMISDFAFLFFFLFS